MSVILQDEAMAYLRTSATTTNVDPTVLQGLIDTAESMVSQRVGPLVSASQSTITQLAALWGLKVVVSDAITENTALVGDFRYAVLCRVRRARPAGLLHDHRCVTHSLARLALDGPGQRPPSIPTRRKHS